MKDFMDLQQAWARHERKLDQNLKLNLELLRKVNLKSTRSKLRQLVWQNSLTAIFYVFAALYFINFAADHRPVWYFMLSGLALAGWSVAIAIAAIKQLRLILMIDYSGPVTELQKKLSYIKIVIIKNLRLAGWALPFHMAFMVVTLKILFGIDIIRNGDPDWLMWNGILAVGFFGVAIFFHRKLSPANVDKKWINWLIQGSGSQVGEALEFLKEIEKFEKEDL